MHEQSEVRTYLFTDIEGSARMWEEDPERMRPALARHDAIARSAVEKHGPQTFGLFSCSKTTNEMNYLAQKFARTVVGSNNIDSCNRT